MPEYKVKQGDCIASIAQNHGIPWEKIWNHPKNSNWKNRGKIRMCSIQGTWYSSLIKKRRRNRGLQNNGIVLRLRKALLFAIGYGGSSGWTFSKPTLYSPNRGSFVEAPKGSELKTDDKGIIECEIPPGVTEAKVTIDNDNWLLRLGALDRSIPLKDCREGLIIWIILWAQSMESWDLVPMKPFEIFSGINDLVIDGKYGPRTQQKLKEVYGCWN